MTTQEIAQGLVYGYAWSMKEIRYSFKETQLSYESTQDYEGSVPVSTAIQTATHQIMNELNSLIDVHFTYTPEIGDIVFSSKVMGDPSVLGYAYLPTPNDLNRAGDIYLNAYFKDQDFEVGGMGWRTIIHELGHALGLDHPFGEGAYEGVDIHDSVMSYNNHTGIDSDNHAYDTWSHLGYQSADILALQSLYGVHQESRNDTYLISEHLPSKAIEGSFGTLNETMSTLYDYGGEDTLSFLGMTENQSISLNATQDSIIRNDTLTLYLSLTPNSTIEHVIGGLGNDTIYLNNTNNIIDGGEGNDHVILQNNGTTRVDLIDDTLILSNKESGFDTLTNIETLTLNNQTINPALYQRQAQTYEEPIASEISRLYLSVFERLPDKEGLDYWIKEYQQGNTLKSIANAFIVSHEFHENYGTAIDDEAYIKLLYNNVLYREADSAGLNYWINEIHTQNSTYSDVLLSFSNSEEFIKLTGVYFEENQIFLLA